MSSTLNFEQILDMFPNKVSREYDAIVIAGPTCVGKSSIAIELARKINGVILNADSVQVYSDLKLFLQDQLKKINKVYRIFYTVMLMHLQITRLLIG